MKVYFVKERPLPSSFSGNSVTVNPNYTLVVINEKTNEFSLYFDDFYLDFSEPSYLKAYLKPEYVQSWHGKKASETDFAGILEDELKLLDNYLKERQRIVKDLEKYVTRPPTAEGASQKANGGCKRRQQQQSSMLCCMF